MRLVAVIIVAAACGSGCSLFAKKVDTPAARLSPQELAALPAPPNERYYLILFGSQDSTRRPAYTHTWATLVRAAESPDAACPTIEAHTISWLPCKMDIDALSRHVEPGRNFPLEETIANSLRTKQEIAMWGPYEVWHGFAFRFRTQKAFLDSGAVGYQCIDTRGEAAREGNGCDCIHAISDMDPQFPRWRYPLALYGQPGTRDLVGRLMRAGIVMDGGTTHDWLLPRLGLDRCDIERKQYRGRVVPHDFGNSVIPGRPCPNP